MKKILTGLALILALGCSGEHSPDLNSNPSPEPAIQYNAPEFSYKGKKPIEKIDPKDISQVNNGYFADLDNDGKIDFAIMRGNALSFRKGLGDGKFLEEVVVLNVKGEVRAYKIDTPKGENKPGLFIYDQNCNGFLQRVLGVNDQGIPYFGEMEKIEE